MSKELYFTHSARNHFSMSAVQFDKLHILCRFCFVFQVETILPVSKHKIAGNCQVEVNCLTPIHHWNHQHWNISTAIDEIAQTRAGKNGRRKSNKIASKFRKGIISRRFLSYVHERRTSKMCWTNLWLKFHGQRLRILIFSSQKRHISFAATFVSVGTFL